MKRFVFCFLLISLVFLFAACGEGVTTTKGDEVTTEPKVTTLPKDTTQPEVTTAQKTDPNEVVKPDDTTGEEGDSFEDLFDKLGYMPVDDDPNVEENIDEITFSYTCTVKEKIIKAGERAEFKVTVTNESAEDCFFRNEITLVPEVALYAQGSDTPLCKNCLTIIPADDSLYLFPAGSTAPFTLWLTIPADAMAGDYTLVVSNGGSKSARFENILSIVV